MESLIGRERAKEELDGERVAVNWIETVMTQSVTSVRSTGLLVWAPIIDWSAAAGCEQNKEWNKAKEPIVIAPASRSSQREAQRQWYNFSMW